jgi:hypothetical protein
VDYGALGRPGPKYQHYFEEKERGQRMIERICVVLFSGKLLAVELRIPG